MEELKPEGVQAWAPGLTRGRGSLGVQRIDESPKAGLNTRIAGRMGSHSTFNLLAEGQTAEVVLLPPDVERGMKSQRAQEPNGKFGRKMEAASGHLGPAQRQLDPEPGSWMTPPDCRRRQELGRPARPLGLRWGTGIPE